ncbi:PQQ-dependent sugar dehydrogenase [Fodinibius sp. SL11]|uniref:PQQ-dependent sugar dehydrogenase n=1 Tax=Fodinibius sp. SL11 TaxID=3425690 RepID=UPI003F884B09
MHKSAHIGIILGIGLMLVSCTAEPDTAGNRSELAFEQDTQLQLPEGFQAVVVAEDVGPARHLTIRDNGDIYLALSEKQDGAGTAALRDTNGDGVADEIKYFGEHTGTGIAIRDGYLYRSSDLEVFRYEMPEKNLIPSSEAETIVTGLPDQNTHAAKSFTFDNSGNLYVNVGGPSNACQEEGRTPGSPGQDPCPQLERQAGIWQFSADQLAQDQQKDGHRYATGIRNAVALDWNSSVNKLYAVQHGRDQLSALWPDFFDEEENAELPAEEFFAIDDGDNFGWPYSYYDQFQEKRVLAPEYGGDGEEVGQADNFEDPIYAFPGHWAPNDLLFYNGEQFPEKYRKGAFVAFHGSWNRAPETQEGYRVSFLPFDGEAPSGEDETFANNFAGVDTIKSPGDAEHRPMGLATGPDGSLYISDSVEGNVWRIVYTGN